MAFLTTILNKIITNSKFSRSGNSEYYNSIHNMINKTFASDL